jgi:hypothetical protein
MQIQKIAASTCAMITDVARLPAPEIGLSNGVVLLRAWRDSDVREFRENKGMWRDHRMWSLLRSEA